MRRSDNEEVRHWQVIGSKCRVLGSVFVGAICFGNLIPYLTGLRFTGYGLSGAATWNSAANVNMQKIELLEG